MMDADHLKWIFDRLEKVHGESPYVDYMQQLKRIIDNQRPENQIHELVCKLVGPIDPVGESHTDDKRFENLKVMAALVEKLIQDIDQVAYQNRNALQSSRQKAHDYASKFLSESLGIKDE